MCTGYEPASRSTGSLATYSPAMPWDELGDWWIEEIADDPAYHTVVTPLLLEVLEPKPGLLYLDLGAGEGQVMRKMSETGARVVGVELNEGLARAAGCSVVGRIPEVPIAGGSVDGVYAVLVVEHLNDHAQFFAEAARVTRPGGVLAVVMNHPVWTAPRATPVADLDGELLWRPGDYFASGATDVPTRGRTVTFHHRSLGDLLSSAAEHRWSLEALIERPHHEPGEIPGVPRLLASRWRLLP